MVPQLFSLALRLYPSRFRAAVGDDMRRYFADRWVVARRDRRALAFLVRTLVNLVATAAAEHWRSSLEPGGSPHDRPRKGEPVSNFLQDVRYAVRVLRRQPGFALFVILTLGTGVGANTAVFSVVNDVLLKPLPYPESDRLVSVIGRFDPESGFNFPEFPLSPPEFVDYRAEARALEDVAAHARRSINVGGPGAEPERVVSAAVSANLFGVLRVQPFLGRGFAPSDDTPDAAPTAVLSYRLLAIPIRRRPPGAGPHGSDEWRRDDDHRRHAGGLHLPWHHDPHLGAPAHRRRQPRQPQGARDLGHRPPCARSLHGQCPRGGPHVDGRLESAVPDVHTGHYLFIVPLLPTGSPARCGRRCCSCSAPQDSCCSIVCANVANVVMARGEVRLREMAIRGALGAQRARLVRLSLVESAVLGITGGALGVALAYTGVRALLAIDPTSIPRASEVTIDGRMLLFAAAVSLLSVVLFGLIPALRGASTDLQSTLREGSPVNERLDDTPVGSPKPGGTRSGARGRAGRRRRPR